MSTEQKLSPSEQDILSLLLNGRKTAEIAELRGTTAATVKVQIQSIYRRLGVHSRVELVMSFLGGKK